MAFLAMLFRCRLGNTSWNSILFVVKYHFSSAGHSLSRICISGFTPLCFRYSCIFVIAQTSLCSDCDFNASAKIALASSSYTTMMYLEPLLEVLGNLPVWSEKVSHSFPYILSSSYFVGRYHLMSSSFHKKVYLVMLLFFLLFCWSLVLPGLAHVAFDGVHAFGKMLSYHLRCEPWQRGIVVVVDGCYPCRWHWRSRSTMQVSDNVTFECKFKHIVGFLYSVF